MSHPLVRKLMPILMISTAAAIFPSTPQGNTLGTPRWDTPRVMGQAWFQNGCRSAMMHVMARHGRWGRPSFGVISYADEDPTGAVRYYHATLDGVRIEANNAVLSGRINDTNVAEWEGLGVQVWMVDSFKPDGTDDEVAAMFFDWPGTLPYPYTPMFTPILEGNLEVMQ